jgi:hypothetical protein
MVYKIKWQRGGESASRFSTRKGANEALMASRFKGSVIKTQLGNAGFSPISKTPLKWTKRKTKEFGLVYTPRAK